jgi:aspartate aminotransferase
MGISGKINKFMAESSWIRKMFEEGLRMKKELGEEKVQDLTLGNPVMEPPKVFEDKLTEIVTNPEPGMHRYMPNAGYEFCRDAVAKYYQNEVDLPVEARHVVMTVGAAGGLNVVLKSLLDPGDEVIIFAPYFVEYLFYIDNHGGSTEIVKTNDDFSINVSRLEAAITEKTKAVLINSPNNPTGVVYGEYTLKSLCGVLRRKQEELGKTIFLINDDPYRKIVYEGKKPPSILPLYENSIVITSHSKDLAVPGERIGHVAVNPGCTEVDKLMPALIFCNRTLGFVNAPALMQRAVASLQEESVDVSDYEKKRDFLYENLSEMGYTMVKPEGAFYLFPKSPKEDELVFVNWLKDRGVLVVPGRGFGGPGYFRISYCIPMEVIERSMPAFSDAAREFGL